MLDGQKHTKRNKYNGTMRFLSDILKVFLLVPGFFLGKEF